LKTRSDTILIESTLNAPIEKVWNAWTEPSLVSKWFGSDPNGEVLKARTDVRVGGDFEITFRDSTGTEHTCSGVYEAVQPYNKLIFTWAWKSEPVVESLVTVLLRTENGITLMQFEHTNVGHASAHNYEQGWKDTFVKLERALAVS